MKKSIFSISCAVILAATIFSCASTSQQSQKVPETETVQEEQLPEPAKKENREPVKTVPTITSKGRGIKIEAEDMFLEDSSLYKDNSASQGYAIKMSEHSVAKCKVVLSAGTWECLVSEQAFKTESSELFVNISGTYYKVYPSNPPLASWELTTRSPVYIHIEQESTVNVSINAGSPYEKGTGGMNIDYIQFVRTN